MNDLALTTTLFSTKERARTVQLYLTQALADSHRPTACYRMLLRGEDEAVRLVQDAHALLALIRQERDAIKPAPVVFGMLSESLFGPDSASFGTPQAERTNP